MLKSKKVEGRPGQRRKVQRTEEEGRTDESTGTATPRLAHPFRANFNDHFETSTEALQDVLPALEELRRLTRPSAPEGFTLYDPYYCAGTVTSLWRELGIHHVLHENRDFYADIEDHTVPGPYDAIVTNPPFSDDHMQRMMEFLIGQSKPWAFLAPDYIAGKDWFQALVRRSFSPAPITKKGNIHAPCGGRRVLPPSSFAPPPFLVALSDTSMDGPDRETCASDPLYASPPILPTEPFYIIPRVRYDFKHPLGVGKDHSHFKSMWYVWMGKYTPEVIRATTIALIHRSAIGCPGSDGPNVVFGMQALIDGKYVGATSKRANPKRRLHTRPRTDSVVKPRS